MKWRKTQFDGYFVSENGQVFSQMRTSPSILMPHLSRKGYLTVCIKVSKGRYGTAFVHGLVAHAFLGEKPAGMQVNHKDANKLNNHFTNLEYVTPKENINHAIKNGIGSAFVNSQKLFCKKGHPYDAENTYFREKTDGKIARQCRTCCGWTKNKPFIKRKKNFSSPADAQPETGVAEPGKKE